MNRWQMIKLFAFYPAHLENVECKTRHFVFVGLYEAQLL